MAFASNYSVTGWENTSSGGSTRWTGGHGYIYVIVNAAAANKHVNAMFMIYSNSNPLQMNYESGWKREASGTPIYFAARMLNGVQTKANGNNAAEGTWPLFTVKVDSTDPGAPARMMVGNTTLMTHSPAMFPDARIWYSSERNSLSGDTNFGDFDHLMRRDNAFNWALFTNNVRRQDNDAYYHLERISHPRARIHKPNGRDTQIDWWH